MASAANISRNAGIGDGDLLRLVPVFIFFRKAHHTRQAHTDRLVLLVAQGSSVAAYPLDAQGSHLVQEADRGRSQAGGARLVTWVESESLLRPRLPPVARHGGAEEDPEAGHTQELGYPHHHGRPVTLLFASYGIVGR